ncbi:MAG: helix-turn-helix transcriptional regulator [Nitratireductor sp.]|nr:helix-turn-helix transcriptional regulator [Nitratireductor sp.]
MTLSELCEALGRSIGWLSQVERGQTEPSIPDLKAIAAQFRVPVSFFFRNADAPNDERGWIVRGSARAVMGSAEDGLQEELLSPDISGDFEMIRSVFAPGMKRAVMAARDTQDGGYVVSGELELTIGSNTYLLKAGDSFQFNRQPYGWANRGSVPAVVIWVISPPAY